MRPHVPNSNESLTRISIYVRRLLQAASQQVVRPMMIPAVTAAVLLLQLYSAGAQTGPPAGCPTSCGDVSVPYPFGIGDRCSWPGFNLTCDRSRRPARLLIGGGGTLEVAEISVANSTVRVIDTAGAVNLTFYSDSSGANGGNGTWGGGLGGGGPFVVSESRCQLVLTGCNVQATLNGDGGGGNIITGCSSFCSVNDRWTGVVSSFPASGGAGVCSGIGCCQTPIPIGRPSYAVAFKWLDTENTGQLTNAVRVAERGWFDGASASLLNGSLATPVPVVLEWAMASAPVVLPGVAVSGCPKDAAGGACRSGHSLCVNVTGNYRSGYVCQCEEGYGLGNPYLAGGCQDINECALPGNCFGECTNTPGSYTCQCPPGARGNPRIKDGCVKSSIGLSVGIGVGSSAGLLFLVFGAIFVTRKLKRRRAKMLRQKFFKQNRGHLLQQLVSQKADIAERMIIPLAELEKATNNFDKAREISEGGHGKVYKGILSDLHVVAIKKSKFSVQREIDEFVNEVAILSQINHRNVVKLFGCCLETEVPLLVYEFISNGTLYHHLHVEGPASLPWEHRLRIAIETARSLAYLHSDVSFPIVHRDIKSQNILLDDTLIAKVSDFGASRCIPADDQAETAGTAIQGTFGYLDPMYYYTGRLTEMSDVYSFGVVLMELLTRKKPQSYRSSDEESLVQHFTALLGEGEGSLARILDRQVVEEGGKQVEEVAVLAVACVRLNGEDRPSMRQVEMALESLRAHGNVVLRDVDAENSEEIRSVPWGRGAVEGTTGSSEETTRQYSLEEEYLLSSRYPR